MTARVTHLNEALPLISGDHIARYRDVERRPGQLWERVAANSNHETPIIANCVKHGDVGTIRDSYGALLCQVCGRNAWVLA
jgi:hypothetical protein